jgi:hypothetical protein
MSPEEARREALLRFGNPTSLGEKVIAVDVALFLENLVADIRYAFRQLRKSPGFAATTILMLALGIGANTAILTLLHALLLQSLPVSKPEQLYSLSDGESREPSIRDTTSNGDCRRGRIMSPTTITSPATNTIPRWILEATR